MNPTLFGLGVALVVALPATASAQRPEKPTVERAPVLKRGNPTAAPKAAPAVAPTTGARATGQLSPAARATNQADGEPEEDGPVQARAGLVSEGDPEDDEEGIQSRAAQVSEGDPEEEEDIQARAGQVSEGDPEDEEEIQAQPGLVGAPGQAQVPGQGPIPGQVQTGMPGGAAAPARPR
jgi:hypothetical protein